MQPEPPREPSDEPRPKKQPINRMPESSVFYERIVPILLIGLGLLLVAMIATAAAILLGLIPSL